MGSPSPISGKCVVNVSNTLALSSVLHIPCFSTNLLSISRVTRDLNCSVTFSPSHCVFQDLSTKKTIGSGEERNGLYFLLPEGVTNKELTPVAHTSQKEVLSEETWLWHKRLGHTSFYLFHFLFPTLVSNKSVSEISCEVCELGKHHRATFHSNINKSAIPFSLIHTDVWGPSHIPTMNGFRWFASFTDDCTRTTWVYFVKEKNAVFSIFKNFHKMICTQFNTVVRIVWFDKGGSTSMVVSLTISL